MITGIGAVSALGRGVARIWSAIAEGTDGIAPIRRFDPSDYVPLAGMVPDRNAPEHGSASFAHHCVEFAIDAAREAWSSAELGAVDRGRIALVMGSSLGDPDVPIFRMTEAVGDALGIVGPRLTVSTACASSTNALGLALDLLAAGVADVVIAGGADVLTPLVLAGFHALGVLTPGKCAPFSEPAGTSLGEGAGFLVLERRETAVRRGRTDRMSILGYGLSADAFHDTGPDPTGSGVARAICSALDHAGVDRDEIDYVNAHGTGTRANDPAEWRAIQHVFGARAATLPISSSKSFLGHAQGAAGVLETIATLVAMERGMIPPTQRFTVARPNSPGDVVGQATARIARCEIAVCTNSAFGGANCAIVVGRGERVSNPVARRDVFVAGSGLIGPEMERASGSARGFRFEQFVPSADPRGLDPSTRFLTAATAIALDDAGVKLRGETRDRTGLVLGVTVASPESDRALYATIDEHGHRGLSASLFSRQVLNAPAGTCCRLLGLRGAHSTVSAGSTSGLFALAYAAELVATRRDSDRIVAAGVDEVIPGEAGVEGAACAVLSTTPSAVRVAAWQIAGPGGIDGAVAAALAVAAIGDRVDLVVGHLPRGVVAGRHIALTDDTPAFGPMAAVIAAATLIRNAGARHVLIAQTGGQSADCAIVLVASEARKGGARMESDHAS